MKLELSNIGKHFAYRWVFKNISLQLETGQSLAITGPNGIGKSTLLKIIASYMEPSEGKVEYSFNGKPVEQENIYNHIGMAAPYMELINEYSLSELIQFYSCHKKVNDKLINEAVLAFKLDSSLDKSLKYFSSGMLQRTKLLLALGSDSKILLLDEPHTNLDSEGIETYGKLLDSRKNDSVVIISSNRKDEISFCDSKMELNPL
ncbi:MAG: ATP-binding cassette domain-containing protein [Bacteroidia bacterium]|nr:ATP-binding cassette domain-containing protein [Bacteroidia bacterium]NNC85525.1 ATP-binding cassette domain-containing protein [Bacteroidia bacterium]